MRVPFNERNGLMLLIVAVCLKTVLVQCHKHMHAFIIQTSLIWDDKVVPTQCGAAVCGLHDVFPREPSDCRFLRVGIAVKECNRGSPPSRCVSVITLFVSFEQLISEETSVFRLLVVEVSIILIT